MNYRNANYCAFYVDEPVNEWNLGANTAHDLCYYRQLQAWKAVDSSFPFIDAHGKTYSVRDGSDWEGTLKPRLHKRLSESKNIILFLSSITRDSRALHEEIKYGMVTLGLPVIVVYPDIKDESDIVSNGRFSSSVTSLWDKLPIFWNHMNDVPVLHIPYKKDLIEKALQDKKFMINTKTEPGNYIL